MEGIKQENYHQDHHFEIDRDGCRQLGGGISPGGILLELQLKLSVRGGGESSGSLNTFIICAAGHRYDIFRYINQEPNLGYVLERQYRLLGFLS